MTRAATRSGCHAANVIALWPPIECPTTIMRAQPSTSIKPDQVAREILGPVGRRLGPGALAVTALVQ